MTVDEEEEKKFDTCRKVTYRKFLQGYKENNNKNKHGSLFSSGERCG